MNELCLAKSGEVWYRATLVEAVGDGNPLVMLIDSEEFIRISTKNLRKMPKHFLTPKLIHLYRIKGNYIKKYICIFKLYCVLLYKDNKDFLL